MKDFRDYLVEIPAWAAKYIGIPYKDKGRDRSGVDCWGLVRLVLYEQLGLNLPDYPIEPADSSSITSEIDRAKRETWKRIRNGAERLFDVAHMNDFVKVGKHWELAPVHVGLVLGNGWILHSRIGAASKSQSYLLEPKFRNYILGFYRYQNAV